MRACRRLYVATAANVICEPIRRRWMSMDVYFLRATPFHQRAQSTYTAASIAPSSALWTPKSHSSSSHPYVRVCDLNHIPLHSSVRVCGWVRSVRQSKGTAFIIVNDGTAHASIQCAVPPAMTDGVTLGAAVQVDGKVILQPRYAANPSAEADNGRRSVSSLEVAAEHLTVLGTSASSYPIGKQRLSMEHLRDHNHLRFRTNTLSAIMRIRHVVCDGLMLWLKHNGFVWVHTPIITPLDCEGGGETFIVKAPDDIDTKTAVNNDVDSAKKSSFFGRNAFLGVSGQLYAEMMAQSLTRVYAFGPTFRAEKSATPRHLAEFWMIEPEMCFADLNDIITAVEQSITFTLQHVVTLCQDELTFLSAQQATQPSPRPSPSMPPTRAVDLITRLRTLSSTTFERVSYTDAIHLLSEHHLSSSRPFDYEPKWGDPLQSEHERFIASHYGRPVFVTDYPIETKPFYMRGNDDGRTAACTDLLVPDIGELVGGGQREERYDRLLERMSACNMDERQYEWYTQLRLYGSCVHGGFGMGIERLLMMITGINNVRDLIPVPRTANHIRF